MIDVVDQLIEHATVTPSSVARLFQRWRILGSDVLGPLWAAKIWEFIIWPELRGQQQHAGRDLSISSASLPRRRLVEDGRSTSVLLEE